MRKFFWLFLLLPSIAQAQVSVALSPVPAQQFLSNTGAPLASGCVNTYITGTSTPLATYTDGTGGTPNANPIILDAGGFANIWLSNASYRFVIVAYDGIPGNKCAAGVTQRTVDNVSAYTVINQAQNIFLTGANSDPSGTAGELAYRTDLSCFRGFTTFWDCFVRLTDTQTLTNKTLAAPTITGAIGGSPSIANATLSNPNINGVVVPGFPATYVLPANDVTTGTTANTLTKLLGATAIISAAGDAGGVIGITVSGAGKTGFATIQENGATSCVFDNATTAGDYVQISSTVAGNCHDVGSAYPLNGNQIIGRVTVTAGAGTNGLILFGPEFRVTTSAPIQVNLTGQSGNCVTQTFTTPGANGFYRAQTYLVITQAATTSSTTPTISLNFTDADSGIAQVYQQDSGTSSNTLGLTVSQGSQSFFAKSGVAVTLSCAGYASSGATPMQYAIHSRLEGPF